MRERRQTSTGWQRSKQFDRGAYGNFVDRFKPEEGRGPPDNPDEDRLREVAEWVRENYRKFRCSSILLHIFKYQFDPKYLHLWGDDGDPYRA